MFYKINNPLDIYFLLPSGTSKEKIYEYIDKYNKYKQLTSIKFNSGLYCNVFYFK
jgi:hypothetical protein